MTSVPMGDVGPPTVSFDMSSIQCGVFGLSGSGLMIGSACFAGQFLQVQGQIFNADRPAMMKIATAFRSCGVMVLLPFERYDFKS